MTIAALTGQAETKVFRSISEIATASHRDYCRASRFELTAQVISKRGSNVTLHDGIAGNTFRDQQYHPQPFEAGDIVKVKGGLEAGRGSWHFLNLRVVTVIGRRPLPPIHKLNGSEINDASFLHQRARMQGVLTSTVPDDTDPQFTWLTLNTPSGPFMTFTDTNSWDLATLGGLIDSEMEVTGVVVPFEGWRKDLGQYITPESPEGIRVIAPAPDDPFAVPEFNHTASPQHRRKATGRIMAVGNDRFYLKTAEYPLVQIIPAESAFRPKTGDYLETVGFIRKSPFNPTLSNALMRPTAEQPSLSKESDVLAQPRPFNDKRLKRVNTLLNGRIIRTTGFIDRMNDDPNDGFVLTVDGSEFTVETQSLDLSSLRLTSHCKATVTGLCVLRFSAPFSQDEFPHFDRFILIPRTPGEVVVVERPSWWTPSRLLIVIIGMMIVLIGILIWNHALRILSDRRGRELVRERLEQTKTKGKIEERTRLAVELHDSISQMLTGVALQLDSAVRAEAEGKASPKRFLDSAKQMLGSCRKELQDCLWDLRTRTFAEQNLTEAISRTLAPHISNVHLDVRFNVPRQNLSESTTHTILSIVRELCVNAIRHGHADRLRVAGESHGDSVSFSVTDNGVGFDPNTVEGPSTGHFGLTGIRERLAAYNGKLTVDSSPRRGCRISVVLTINPSVHI